MTAAAPERVKPRLRGVSHQYGFFVSLGLGAYLVASAQTARAAVGSAVFAFSLSGLLGTSALYHRIDWSPARRAVMRRLDHSMIYVLISGTFTPVALAALSKEQGHLWLAIAWSLALAGGLFRVVWFNAPKWITPILAVALGWLPIGVLPEIKAALGWTPVIFFAMGGLAYTTGAVIYALKRPDPLPEVFGYHEIFHALVLTGAGWHYAVIYLWLT